MAHAAGFAEAGVARWSGLEDARAVAAGLPASSVEALAARVAPGDGLFKYRLVPKATWARRRGGTLSPAEGERVMRLSRVFDYAIEVYGEEGARAFLFDRNMVLEMQRPIDMTLAGETGAAAALRVLGQAYHGVAV